MKQLLLRAVWVIFASTIGSIYMLGWAHFLIDTNSWGHPRRVDIEMTVFLVIALLGFGAIAFLSLKEMAEEIKSCRY